MKLYELSSELSYRLRKHPITHRIGLFIFDVDEGYSDAAVRFGGGRRDLKGFYHGLGFLRGVSYRIGWVLGRGNDRRYGWGGYAWKEWSKREGRNGPSMDSLLTQGFSILSGKR